MEDCDLSVQQFLATNDTESNDDSDKEQKVSQSSNKRSQSGHRRNRRRNSQRRRQGRHFLSSENTNTPNVNNRRFRQKRQSKKSEKRAKTSVAGKEENNMNEINDNENGNENENENKDESAMNNLGSRGRSHSDGGGSTSRSGSRSASPGPPKSKKLQLSQSESIHISVSFTIPQSNENNAKKENEENMEKKENVGDEREAKGKLKAQTGNSDKMEIENGDTDDKNSNDNNCNENENKNENNNDLEEDLNPPPLKKRKLNSASSAKFCENHHTLENDASKQKAKKKKKNVKQRKPIPKLTFEDLNCQICFDLPKGNIYQCREGHILCHDCHKKLREQKSCNCPLCRCPVSRRRPIRNRIAERWLASTQLECSNDGCHEMIEFAYYSDHIENECEYRNVCCKYQLLGCKWHGFDKDLNLHLKNECEIENHDKYFKNECPIPKILQSVTKMDSERKKAEKLEMQRLNKYVNVSKMFETRCRDISVRDVIFKAGQMDNRIYMFSNEFESFHEGFQLVIKKEIQYNSSKKARESFTQLKMCLICKSRTHNKRRRKLLYDCCILKGHDLNENCEPCKFECEFLIDENANIDDLDINSGNNNNNNNSSVDIGSIDNGNNNNSNDISNGNNDNGIRDNSNSNDNANHIEFNANTSSDWQLLTFAKKNMGSSTNSVESLLSSNEDLNFRVILADKRVGNVSNEFRGNNGYGMGNGNGNDDDLDRFSSYSRDDDSYSSGMQSDDLTPLADEDEYDDEEDDYDEYDDVDDDEDEDEDDDLESIRGSSRYF